MLPEFNKFLFHQLFDQPGTRNVANLIISFTGKIFHA